MRSGIIFQGFYQGYRSSVIVLPCTIKISKSPPVQHPNLLIRAVSDGGQQETAGSKRQRAVRDEQIKPRNQS